jgi:hypothetical protein
VREHVISCDLCGQRMAMPTAMKHAEKQSREELVRSYAVGWGWRRAEDGDRCPHHEVDHALQERLTHRLSGFRSRLPGLPRNRSLQPTDAISPRVDGRPASA